MAVDLLSEGVFFIGMLLYDGFDFVFCWVRHARIFLGYLINFEDSDIMYGSNMI